MNVSIQNLSKYLYLLNSQTKTQLHHRESEEQGGQIWFYDTVIGNKKNIHLQWLKHWSPNYLKLFQNY